VDETGDLVYRYTHLASALDILLRRRLTLMSPARWSDQNDVAFIKAYKAAARKRTVRALCFTGVRDLSLHWNEFAPGTDGVRLEIVAADVRAEASRHPGVKFDRVDYRTIREIQQLEIRTDRLPFTKRIPYQGEQELRLIYSSDQEMSDPFELPLHPTSIKHIVLGPRTHEALVAALQQVIHGIEGCAHIQVYKTTLQLNKKWVQAVAAHGQAGSSDT